MTVTIPKLMIAGAFALAAAVAFAPPGFAQGKGGGNAGGTSAGHISTQGGANTNGPNASDRGIGLDRAGDRANSNADGKMPSSQQTGQAAPATRRTK